MRKATVVIAVGLAAYLATAFIASEIALSFLGGDGDHSRKKIEAAPLFQPLCLLVSFPIAIVVELAIRRFKCQLPPEDQPEAAKTQRQPGRRP
jgi:hypothetical protein